MTRQGRAGKGIRTQARSQFSTAHEILSRAAPHVTTHWLGDPAYRDKHGTPRRLRLRGAGPSLAKLILRVMPKGSVDQIAAFLVQSGAVRKVGTHYELESRFVPFRADLGTAFAYTVVNVQRYLNTVTHNLACTDPEDTYVERSAINRHIPVWAAPKIHRYLKRQLGNLISRADAYLQRWEVEPGSEPTLELGINAFASEQREADAPGTRRAGAKERLRRRSRRTS
jgi:hypothetical protein